MPSIGLLALSTIVDDPRVRRQGDAFHDAGWQVSAVGLSGGRSPAPRWQVVGGEGGAQPAATGAPAVAAGSRMQNLWRGSVPQPLRTAARPFLRQGHRIVLATRYARSRRSYESALRAYWKFAQFRDLYERARTLRPDIWLANDWNTLPIAARLSAETGTPFGYDTHEFATSEYEERRVWRVLQRPMVALIEERLIRSAACVSSVSPGISEALQRMYGLAERPLTIVNAPAYEESAFRPTSEPARVLYHGGVTVGRGLEASIESVAKWRNARTLTIRGPVEPAYLSRLQGLAERHGVARRVSFEGPVAMTSLVREARPFDVGLLALPAHSQHNAFALPNKFFEYAMAGLAVCMTDLPEMSRLIAAHRMGVTIDDATPAAIAASVNAMEADEIDAYKRNALEAARVLCWEAASRELVERYRHIVDGATKPAEFSRA